MPRKRVRGSAGGHSTFLPCMVIITCKLLICKLERQHFFMLICSYQSHFTRSLNSFLYLFNKIVLVPRKRVRGSAGGHFCQRATPIILFRGKPTILSYFSLCPIFSCICVRSSLKIFSQIYFFNLLFLRTKRYQERDLGLIIRPVLSWFCL